MERVYRCGQCSRLDKSPGTVVIVVSHDIDYTSINMYPAPRNAAHIQRETEVMLCADCYKEVFPTYGT